MLKHFVNYSLFHQSREKFCSIALCQQSRMARLNFVGAHLFGGWCSYGMHTNSYGQISIDNTRDYVPFLLRSNRTMIWILRSIYNRLDSLLRLFGQILSSNLIKEHPENKDGTQEGLG